MDATKALEFILKESGNYAKHRAERKHIEQYLRTKRAQLYQQAPDGTVADREAYAYGHPEYESLLEGLKAAVEEEERLGWLLRAAEHRIEIWRSIEATNRFIDKGTT